jgi:hypothetical protein
MLFSVRFIRRRLQNGRQYVLYVTLLATARWGEEGTSVQCKMQRSIVPRANVVSIGEAVKHPEESDG